MKRFPVFMVIGFVFLLCMQNVSAVGFSNAEIGDKPLHLWVPYDSEKPADLNNLDNKYIFIQEKDLEEIKNSKNPKNVESGDPPKSYQITSVNYNVNAENDVLKIQGVYKINKLDNEWVLIPVISDKTGVYSAVLGQNKAFIVNKPDNSQNYRSFKNFRQVKRGYNYLVLKKKGSYVLTLDFTEDIVNAPSQNTKSFSFQLPKVPITNIECDFGEKNLAVQVSKAVAVETKETAKGSKVIASLPPVETIEVKWTPKSELSNQAMKNLPPSISAVTYSKIEMGRGSLKGTFNADVDIRRSSMSKFKFFIPDDIEIDSISVKDNELVDPYPDVKGNILPLELTSPVEGRVEFTISYRKNFDNSSFKTKIPAITLVNKNIDRETGFVAAVETTNIESSIIESDKTKNFKEIDSKELEGDLRGTRASIALKYTKNKENVTETPYDITINVVKHKDVAVYEANLESMDITSILNSDGNMFTKAKMQIRNTGKQFLDITLPENSSIWSVYVNNKSVKPAMKDEAKGIYAIPLVKSNSLGRGGKAFPVEIVYFTDNAVPGLSFGFTNLKAITTELVANTVNWKLYVPEKINFTPVTAFSNLLKDKKLRRHRSMGYNFNNYNGAVQQEMLQSKSAFEDEDYKMDSFSRSKKSYAGKGQVRKEMSRQAYKSKKVGKLPVYVNLPMVGNSFSFYQLSFEANKSPVVAALHSNLFISNFLTLLLLAGLGFVVLKSCKAKDYKSVGFISSTVISTALLYSIIGLNLLWLAALGGIITLFKKKIIKIPRFISKKVFIVAGSIVGGLVLLAVSFFIFPEFTMHLVVILGGLGLFSLGLFVLYKIARFLFEKLPFKKKPEKEQEQDTDLNVEGNN